MTFIKRKMNFKKYTPRYSYKEYWCAAYYGRVITIFTRVLMNSPKIFIVAGRNRRIAIKSYGEQSNMKGKIIKSKNGCYDIVVENVKKVDD